MCWFHNNKLRIGLLVGGGRRAYAFSCFHFNFMQTFLFQYQFDCKGLKKKIFLENYFGPIVI